jgi:ribosomal protein S19E (S16A)
MAPFYQQKMREAMEKVKLPNHWFVLSLARGAEPEPLSSQRYHQLIPYAKDTYLDEHLDQLKHQKWLKKVGSGEYLLSNKGKKAIEEVYRAAHSALGVIQLSPAEEISDLNNLLWRIVESVFVAKEPVDKWSILYSRWSDPGDGAKPLVKTDQYLTDLARFRNDAHIAAWMPFPITAQALETLTLVWRGEAHTAEELAKELDFRGYTAKEYRVALLELAAQGWLEQTLDGFKVTEQGKRLREEIEKETDRIYFIPWSCLESDERERLLGSIGRLHERLRTMEALVSSTPNP